MLSSDPTRKVIIKGKEAAKKKPKFLSQFQLQALLQSLSLGDEPNWDWFILLVAKTGMRFSETLALTPADFDFTQKKVKITKTWNYKNANGGFKQTKNLSSKRTIQIDPQLAQQFSALTDGFQPDKPIFVHGRVFNSTVNNRLEALCKKAGVPVISVHSLRHCYRKQRMYNPRKRQDNSSGVLLWN